MWRLFIGLLYASALPRLGAQFDCNGASPDWSLTLQGETARFVFPAPTDMDVMLETLAEGQNWPRAFTLIGDRDTAILLIEEEICVDPQSAEQPYRAHVMTQRGQTPILLIGCCRSK